MNQEIRFCFKIQARHRNVVGTLFCPLDQTQEEQLTAIWQFCCQQFSLAYQVVFQSELELTAEQQQITHVDTNEPFGLGMINPQPGVLMAIGWALFSQNEKKMIEELFGANADMEHDWIVVAIGARGSQKVITERILSEKPAKNFIAAIGLTRQAMEEQLASN